MDDNIRGNHSKSCHLYNPHTILQPYPNLPIKSCSSGQNRNGENLDNAMATATNSSSSSIFNTLLDSRGGWFSNAPPPRPLFHHAAAATSNFTLRGIHLTTISFLYNFSRHPGFLLINVVQLQMNLQELRLSLLQRQTGLSMGWISASSVMSLSASVALWWNPLLGSLLETFLNFVSVVVLLDHLRFLSNIRYACMFCVIVCDLVTLILMRSNVRIR